MKISFVKVIHSKIKKANVSDIGFLSIEKYALV